MAGSRSFTHFWLALFSALFVASTAAADEAIKATLSDDTISVGESTQLRIEVHGSGNVSEPSDLAIDGLRISSAGTSRNISYINGAVEFTLAFVYNIEAEKPGAYTIPAMRFNLNGRAVQTQPVALKVQTPEQAGKAGNANGQLASAEIILPNETVYLGETVPVKVRLFLDRAAQPDLREVSSLEGEGFTASNMPRPQVSEVSRNGHAYALCTFSLAITPSRAGKIKVGPVDFTYIAVIQRARQNRPRFPYNFDDDDFNQPFMNFGQREVRKASAEAVELNVKTLPAQNRPAIFSGAIGDFTLSGDGSPKKVKIGDPITMKLRVNGEGNFDRVSAPVLADSKGWRAYPPSENFKADDDTGARGEKTFEVAIIPETKQTKMPVYQFCYFDPRTEKYVTKETARESLVVEGDALPAPAPIVQNPANGTPAPAPSAPPAPQVTDIHGIAYDLGAGRSFRPPYRQPLFWALQCIPLAVLGGGIFLRFWKPKADAGRISSLRRESSSQLAQLRSATDRGNFYERAARVLQIGAALTTGQLPGAVDAATVCRTKKADPETSKVVEEIFHARAEALYAGSSGGAGGGDQIPEAERNRILAVVERLKGGV